MEQGFPMSAGSSDIMSDMPRTTLYTLPRFGWNDLSTKFTPLHRMQWAPRPAASFVGEDLGIEDEGDDDEAGGDRFVRGFSPSYSDCSGTDPFCRIRCTKVRPTPVVNCGDPSSSRLHRDPSGRQTSPEPQSLAPALLLEQGIKDRHDQQGDEG